MLLDDRQRGRSGVTGVGAKVLALGRTDTFDHDGVKHRLQLRYVMPVRSGHD